MQHALDAERDALPDYIGENKHYIFFSGRCNSECRSIITLSKDTPLIDNYYFNVVADSVQLGLLVRFTDSSELVDSIYELEVVDLAHNRNYSINFHYSQSEISKRDFFESAAFSKDKVILKTFMDNNPDKTIEQTTLVMRNKFDVIMWANTKR
jgi:hypothetical protein